jgi:hypothetical protein
MDSFTSFPTRKQTAWGVPQFFKKNLTVQLN